MSFAVVDTVLTGHASAVDLATLGLGLSVYSSVFVGLMGAVGALNPIIAQHFGAGRHAAIGASYGQGLWMALMLSGGGVLLLAFPDIWLPWLHPPPEVASLVARYLRVLSLALPAALMFRAIYSLNTAVSRPHVVMAMQLGGLVLKVLLSYVLIFGALGLPRLGAVGCALASVITFWALFLAGLTYMRLPYLAAFHVFDAIQTVVGFVLRAHKIVIAPTVIYAVALWGVGVFGGYHLAFRGVAAPPWGIAGMWLMQSIALGLAAALLLGVYSWVSRTRVRRHPEPAAA